FQAEDGIRDDLVTGVQTCALPIFARPRYRDLISALRFVARQELIFGVHVHVGIDDPDKAIHVANGMRVHIPILLALSANSPFWRSEERSVGKVRACWWPPSRYIK